MIEIRPMASGDMPGVADQLYATISDAATRGSWPQIERTDSWDERVVLRTSHHLATDPGGCWVAEAEGQIVGHAIAIRRRHLWGLAMLHVLPTLQSHGTGRRLLAATQAYGRDAEGWIITSSDDPRAMRLYATAGLALRPCVEAEGTVRQDALQPAPDVREAGVDDLALTVAVDEVVRGVPHGEGGQDIAALLEVPGTTLDVLDTAQGQGYVCVRDGHVSLLAATTPAAAQQLLWHALARVGSDREAAIWSITGGQQWAIEIAYAAGLRVKPAGPVLTKGRVGPLTPYIPNGQYL